MAPILAAFAAGCALAPAAARGPAPPRAQRGEQQPARSKGGLRASVRARPPQSRIRPVKRSARERADGESVSELTTARLSVYLRSLEALEASGVNTVSSRGLAEQFRL